MNDYPGRPAHKIPAWVKAGSFFHVCIRSSQEQAFPLTEPAVAPVLLDTFSHYHRIGRWFCRLVVLGAVWEFVSSGSESREAFVRTRNAHAFRYENSKPAVFPKQPLMPDHLHAIVVFEREAQMSQVVGQWKSYTAKQVGIHWQTNYFDHRIRHLNELQETDAYMRRNPVVKGLCQDPTQWPWTLSPQSESYGSSRRTP